MKAIICAEMEDLACARDEWIHLVQILPDYPPARVNLAIPRDSCMPTPLAPDGRRLHQRAQP
jgi:hypothetical protein